MTQGEIREDLIDVHRIATDQMTRAILFLVKNGIPLGIAQSLDSVELRAWCIIFSEMNGNEFNWQMGEWIEPE